MSGNVNAKYFIERCCSRFTLRVGQLSLLRAKAIFLCSMKSGFSPSRYFLDDFERSRDMSPFFTMRLRAYAAFSPLSRTSRFPIVIFPWLSPPLFRLTRPRQALAADCVVFRSKFLRLIMTKAQYYKITAIFLLFQHTAFFLLLPRCQNTRRAGVTNASIADKAFTRSTLRFHE